MKTTPTALKTLRSLPSHSGQTVSESSEKLWKVSKKWPQSVQEYWYVGTSGPPGVTRTRDWHSRPSTANATAQCLSDLQTPERLARLGPRSAYVAVVVVLALVAAVVAGVVVARRPLPQVDGTLHLDGLTGKVEVLRDAQGIPQIYADNADDLFRAQGFVQAQDRFFEMDFRRHVTAGRLSELLGEGTVETDMYIRTMGWRRVAASEYDLLAPATRAYLEAYSDGVNAYLEGSSATELSVEYTVLGLTGLDYKPEKWTPVDSLAWLKAMAWDLRGNMDEEIARTRLSVNRTPEQVDELYPRYPYERHAPIVDRAPPTGARRARAAGARARAELRRSTRYAAGVDGHPRPDGPGRRHRVQQLGGLRRPHGLGQAAAGQRPAPERLDPRRLDQMGLHCTTVDADCPFDVSGFTFAGVPGVVIGHNRDIAWGMTNLDPDVTDLYLEKVSGKTYLYDGKQVPLVERDEVIRIAGQLLEADHGAVDPARAAALRRLGGALQRRRERRGRRVARHRGRTATPWPWRGRR